MNESDANEGFLELHATAPCETTPQSIQVLVAVGLFGAAVLTPWLLWPAQCQWLWVLVGLKLWATSFLIWARRVSPRVMNKLVVARLVPASRAESLALTVALRRPFWSIVSDRIFFMPCLEEVLFRLFPSATLGTSWWVGVLAAVVFSVAHNLPGKPLRTFPLSQFIGGLFMWGALRMAGIGAAIWVHAVNNFYSSLIVPTVQAWVFPPAPQTPFGSKESADEVNPT